MGAAFEVLPLRAPQVTRTRVPEYRRPHSHLLQSVPPAWWESSEANCPAGLAVFQEPTADRAHSIDPRDTWMLFVRQSDKGVNGKKRTKGKAKKLKVRLASRQHQAVGGLHLLAPHPLPLLHPEHF